MPHVPGTPIGLAGATHSTPYLPAAVPGSYHSLTHGRLCLFTAATAAAEARSASGATQQQQAMYNETMQSLND